ncbi:MAG: hypothetical protein M1826_005372 [Phylliscum demangeonii]|nr:MAG: hypothetical protein M1826_005372 [Phylliscum demangeonii]
MASAPAISNVLAMLSPPSDTDTLSLFRPHDDKSFETDEHIKNHPLAQSMRANPDFTESRPHLKMAEGPRSHTLTGGTLAGPNKIVVPPYSWSEKGGKTAVSIVYLGRDLCGYPGIVHGGMLATMLDEGLAHCCFPALPNKVGMTANLTINYRNPAPAGNYYVLRAKTVKVEGRKAWVEGHIENLVDEGETATVFVEASALYIEPRSAATTEGIRRLE